MGLLITCTLVTTLYATTMTIANVSLPQIQGALSAGPDQVAWVVTANLIATAVTIPLAGCQIGLGVEESWQLAWQASPFLLCCVWLVILSRGSDFLAGPAVWFLFSFGSCRTICSNRRISR